MKSHVCLRLISAAFGRDVDVEIKGRRTWSMCAQVASAYRADNVFLVGDAAHRFPPTGGLGLNTGIGDIQNLAWKIAAVERGWGGTGLLDSYGDERQHVARSNMGQSVGNSLKIALVYQALGQEMRQPVNRDELDKRLADPAHRGAIAASIAMQAEHFDSLRLQLGYVYGDHRDIDAGTPINVYVPKIIAGACLPHAALAGGGSTLDLIDAGGFAILAGEASGHWEKLVESTMVPLLLLVEGRDFQLAAGRWTQTVTLGADGALLIRPDRHILHVARDANTDEAAAMEAALNDYLKISAGARA